MIERDWGGGNDFSWKNKVPLGSIKETSREDLRE